MLTPLVTLNFTEETSLLALTMLMSRVAYDHDYADAKVMETHPCLIL